MEDDLEFLISTSWAGIAGMYYHAWFNALLGTEPTALYMARQLLVAVHMSNN